MYRRLPSAAVPPCPGSSNTCTLRRRREGETSANSRSSNWSSNMSITSTTSSNGSSDQSSSSSSTSPPSTSSGSAPRMKAASISWFGAASFPASLAGKFQRTQSKRRPESPAIRSVASRGISSRSNARCR